MDKGNSVTSLGHLFCYLKYLILISPIKPMLTLEEYLFKHSTSLCLHVLLARKKLTLFLVTIIFVKFHWPTSFKEKVDHNVLMLKLLMQWELFEKISEVTPYLESNQG